MSHNQQALSLFSRAAVHYKQADYIKAVACYKAGLEIDPTQVEVYADLGKAYEMLGCWDEALTVLELALRLRPGYTTALRRKQRILEEKQIYDAMIDRLNLNRERTDIPRQSCPSAMGTDLKIKRKFFTLTCPSAVSQKSLSVLCQLIEHAYHRVGRIFQCYPQRSVQISIVASDRVPAFPPKSRSWKARFSTLSTLAPHRSLPLPGWAVACYCDGSIWLNYRYDDDSGIGVLYTVIRHEWVHLLTDLLTGGRCPSWFDEGLAQFVARPPMKSESALLHQAIRDGRLLTPVELKRAFNQIEPDQRRLAYLQSRAIAEYLVEQFGFSSIHGFLRQLRAGQPVSTTCQQIFRKPEDEILTAWQSTYHASTARPYKMATSLQY